MPSPLAPLGHAVGVCVLPSRHWATPSAYAFSPRAIGPRCRRMPSPLAPLGHAVGIRLLPSRHSQTQSMAAGLKA
eukprot:1196308-Prorocentrum_minimum.AAC.5